MKILYLGAFRLPNYDAAAPRVLNNAKVFRLVGHEVAFVSWGGKYRDSDLCDDGKYRIDGFEYVITGELDDSGSFANRLKKKFARGKKSLALIEAMEQKPDFIIMYNAGNSWTKAMINVCQKHNIKLANDITEWYDNNELHLTDIIPNYINMTRTQRLVKNKIVISSFLHRFYSESNNLQLPPLCDPLDEKWSKTVEDDRIKPYDGITLIYAGNPAKKDCVHTIINAINQLALEGKKIRFMILGITRESYIQRYNDNLHSKYLHENIIFLGRVSQDLIPAYYKKADFMILLRKPSRKNIAGFPTKFAESITAGIPVISNTTSDLSSYISDGNTGFQVSGYGFDDILTTLRNKVLVLNKENIAAMKEVTLKLNDNFNFKSYSNRVNLFLNNLR